MRSITTYATAAFLSLSVTATAQGQAGRPFRDSWFWGLQGGAMTYSGYASAANPTLAGTMYYAPTVGLDWLITRTHGGLYVSYSQALFSTKGIIVNGPTSADSGYRTVDIDGLRRLDAIGMLFPGDFIKWHPYFGFGVTLRYLANAAAAGPFASSKQIDFANSSVNASKATMGPAFIIGSQYRVKGLSLFAQGIVSTMERDFLLANGHNTGLSAEFGVRYNLSTSVER